MRTTRGSQLTASGAVAADSSRSRVKMSASLTVAEQLLPGWLVSLQAAAMARGEATSPWAACERYRSAV